MAYGVFTDVSGKTEKVRGGFRSWQEAENWKIANGNNPRHYVSQISWCISGWSLK